MKRLAQLVLLLGIFLLLVFVYLMYHKGRFNVGDDALITTAKDLSSFVAMFFSLASILLVLENLKVQSRNADLNMVLTQKSHFEKTFFDLIALQNQIAREIDTEVDSPLTDGPVATKGRGFFDDITDAVTYNYDQNPDGGLQRLVAVYMRYFATHSSDMGHYYRNLLNLVRYASEHPYFNLIKERPELELMAREGYFRILRSQLTNAELTSLALYCMTKKGQSLSTWIHRYRLLADLDFELNLPDDCQCGVPAPDVLVMVYPWLEAPLAEQREQAAALKAGAPLD